MSVPELSTILEQTSADHELDGGTVLLETVERTAGTDNFTLVWNFRDYIPAFKYDDTTEQVRVGDKTATVRFHSLAQNPRPVIEHEIPHIPVLQSTASEGADTVRVDLLETVLDEVVVTVDDLNALFNREGLGVSFVTLSSFDDPIAAAGRHISKVLTGETDPSNFSKSDPDEGLRLDVVLGNPHRIEHDGLVDEDRFEHINQLVVDGQTYPVQIETHRLSDDEQPVGEIVHVTETSAEFADEEPMDIVETVCNIDLDSLLHGRDTLPNDS